MSKTLESAVISHLRAREGAASFSEADIAACVATSRELHEFVRSWEGVLGRFLLRAAEKTVVLARFKEDVQVTRTAGVITSEALTSTEKSNIKTKIDVAYGLNGLGAVAIMAPPIIGLPPMTRSVPEIDVVFHAMRIGHKPSDILPFIRAELDKVAEEYLLVERG